MDRALRILLAEDNPGDVFLVRAALEKHSIGHELMVAKDGRHAWMLIESAEASQQKLFDIFLLDLNLPVRDGLELLARIRKSKGEMSRALVLILTSSDSSHDRKAAARDGADYYFFKPFTLEEFLQLGTVIKDLWTKRTNSTHANS